MVGIVEFKPPIAETFAINKARRAALVEWGLRKSFRFTKYETDVRETLLEAAIKIPNLLT